MIPCLFLSWHAVLLSKNLIYLSFIFQLLGSCLYFMKNTWKCYWLLLRLDLWDWIWRRNVRLSSFYRLICGNSWRRMRRCWVIWGVCGSCCSRWTIWVWVSRSRCNWRFVIESVRWSDWWLVVIGWLIVVVRSKHGSEGTFVIIRLSWLYRWGWGWVESILIIFLIVSRRVHYDIIWIDFKYLL